MNHAERREGLGALERQPAAWVPVRPFEGLRVMDLADGVAGQFCGKLFADQGAHVRLYESPAGSSTRAWTARGLAPTGISALFRHLNADKTCLIADGSICEPGERLLAQLSGADVVITDHVGPLPCWMRQVNPNGVICQITPFGARGAYSNWLGSELIFQALSGVMYQNGLPGQEPLYGVAHRASCAAGAVAFIMAGALLVADRGGEIDVSVAEVATAMNFNLITQCAYSGDVERRSSRTVARTILRSADGWISMFVRDRQWAETAKALDFADLIADARFDTEPRRLRHWDEFEAIIRSRLAGRSADEIVAAGQRVKAAVARAVTPLGLLEDRQLATRNFWRATPETRNLDVPVTSGPKRGLGPMFRLFPYNSDIPAGGSDGQGMTSAGGTFAALNTRAVTGGRPLTGVRVLEIATAWAGPMATRILGQLGADVVKIEGPARMDDWRQGRSGGPVGRYPRFEHGKRPYNRNCQFNTQNTNKRGLGLDLTTSEGQELAIELAMVADVVLTNFRHGYLERIGIAAELLAVNNPGVVVVEMPAYGAGGPIGDHVALGPSMEMMSGMASLIGYGDGKPVTTGPAYLDPIGALNAAAAVISALANRRITGRGASVEVAQREAALHWIGEEIIEAIDHGIDRTPNGNRNSQAAPHRAYASSGEDQWVTVAAFSDAQAHALGRVIGHDIASDPRFSSLDARKKNEDALDELVAAWAGERDKFTAATQLQAAGVHAAAVMAADDLLASDFLAERGILAVHDQPEVGVYVHQNLPLHIAGVDLSVVRPAPRFGEHNREILSDWLELPRQRIDRLYEMGALSDEPTADGPAI